MLLWWRWTAISFTEMSIEIKGVLLADNRYYYSFGDSLSWMWVRSPSGRRHSITSSTGHVRLWIAHLQADGKDSRYQVTTWASSTNLEEGQYMHREIRTVVLLVWHFEDISPKYLWAQRRWSPLLRHAQLVGIISTYHHKTRFGKLGTWWWRLSHWRWWDESFCSSNFGDQPTFGSSPCGTGADLRHWNKGIGTEEQENLG